MNDPLALARARRALAEAGLDPSVHLERADSVTNEVWLSAEHAVRVNRFPDRRLLRESWLGPKLPPDVGYPTTVAYGGEHGADWLIVERRPGTVLSRAWPAMSRDERRRATAQLATLMRRLHETPTPEGLPPTVAPQLLSPTTFPAVEPLLEGIDSLRGRPHVDPGMLRDAESMVREGAPAIEPFTADTLIHGDMHFENVLWDGYVITAILDFEFSRGAPIDLELDVLLRFCAFPFLHVAPDYEAATLAVDYAEIPWWLLEDYPELFAAPRLLDRLRLYSIAYDVRDLLAVPMTRPAKESSPHHPHNRLENLLNGRCHLDVFAGSSTSFDLGPAELLASTGSLDGRRRRVAPLAPGALEASRASGGGIALPRRGASSGEEGTGDFDPPPATVASPEVSDGSPAPPGRRNERRAGPARTTSTSEPSTSDPSTSAGATGERSRGTSDPDVVATIEGGELVVQVGGSTSFRGRVGSGHARQAVVHGDAIIVVLDWSEEHLPAGYNRFTPFPNVIRVTERGEVAWRAELPPREKCFMGVEVDGDRLAAIGWSWQCDLDPATGRTGTARFDA